MIAMSQTFKAFFSGGFGQVDYEPDLYVEAVEEVLKTLADDETGGYQVLRDEFAAHIRESSFPPSSSLDSQWTTDEWLRDVWYDAFGPEPPPGDPYPVPTEHWGHLRQTDYMIYAVKDTPEHSSPGAAAWLERRGLTFGEVRAGVLRPAAECINVRPAPEGWFERLHDLVERGLREEQPGER
ncbi:hypothetical protein [Jiangella asiatica]|uniref:Uncharacterized protein n=1 Tax=Jiangella asiatica TaxID=2530372 RepID=A0A4V2YZK4_9ACTN|nr:hypothetical protein [Jiangella asiatica]TDD97247.1 hypothetical protein E1269_29810 [Jiangella asiatica]